MRFTVEPHHPKVDAFWVKDNEADRWHMPEKAVTLYMSASHAEQVAKILNDEWAAFNANPR